MLEKGKSLLEKEKASLEKRKTLVKESGQSEIMRGKFKPEVKESWLCVILLLGSNTKFEAIIDASKQFGSCVGF